MIEKNEIEKLAALSRLTLTDQEMRALQKDLSSILDYVSELRELNVKDISPTTHAEPVYNVMREDVHEAANKSTYQGAVDAFPSVQNGYLKVKNVFGNE